MLFGWYQNGGAFDNDIGVFNHFKRLHFVVIYVINFPRVKD
jgi:hypothetical protein